MSAARSVRSTRRRRPKNPPELVSPAWYVGYADDDESVEAIMKKFEELEQLQREVTAQRNQSRQPDDGQQQPQQPDPDQAGEPSSLKEHPPDAAGANGQGAASSSRDDAPASGSATPSAAAPQPGPTQATAAAADGEPQFTQTQLEELFRRTSAFTLKSLAYGVDPTEIDDIDMLRFEDGMEMELPIDEEDDYQIVDDDLWEELVGISSSSRASKHDRERERERERQHEREMRERERQVRERERELERMERELRREMSKQEREAIKLEREAERERVRKEKERIRLEKEREREQLKLERERERLERKRPAPGSGAGGLSTSLRVRATNRESAIARYKIMQVEMQDRLGNSFVMKKRVVLPDPNLPTYVRIPQNQIPRSWAKRIVRYTPPRTLEDLYAAEGSRLVIADIFKFDLSKLGSNFQCIYMDPPFLLPGEAPTPGKITVSEFSTLNIPSIINSGFLFIWAEKELTPHIVKAVDAWNFRYVENFCWVKQTLDNKIARQPYKYFNRSKLTCLIFRKEGDATELRHQRNADCEFDFIQPPNRGELTEPKPQFLYEVIETLLPQAVYSAQNPNADRLLELWARPENVRKGWTSIVHRPDNAEQPASGHDERVAVDVAARAHAAPAQ
ncbi:hypothetical protein HK105_205422 [Polyrhizophydium stewartii]|uniref:Uncharacterized protein n=1 Tax=Polyrhizophydium stewartii TaxID=2732419 RepID=A0ABR4N6D5_9FUNG